MPTAAVNDAVLYYEEWGAGPPLLLIAGIPAVVSDWEPLASSLADSYRVIAYDNRGSGGSSVTPGPYSTAQLADDAAGLLDAVGIERAHVFGMSLGGMIAQELALRHPDRVEGLVLGCTHAGTRHAERQPRHTVRAFAMETEDWPARMQALAPLAFRHGAEEEFVRRFVAKKSKDVQNPEGYAAQIAAALGHDTYDRLPDIAAPTLVITGDDDQVIPAASSLPLQERIPGATLHVVRGAGHLFFLERPAETERVLRGFLAGERSESDAA
jgi:3-oxoadipate enol-lactonase